MELGSFFYEDIQVVFYFSPTQELCHALHVLSKPDHHTARTAWVARMEKTITSDLLQEIKRLGDISAGWLIPCDMCGQTDLANMSVDQALQTALRWNTVKWNSFGKHYDIVLDKSQKDRSISVMMQFWQDYFKNELLLLQSLIMKLLPGEMGRCQTVGLKNYLLLLHERIRLEDDEVQFIKNKVYRFKWNEIEKPL